MTKRIKSRDLHLSDLGKRVAGAKADLPRAGLTSFAKSSSNSSSNSSSKSPITGPLAKALSSGRGPSLVFMDVDGVLLSFDPLINLRLTQRGQEPVPVELLDNREHDYLSDAFPERFTLQMEREVVAEVFACGLLRSQPGYGFLDTQAIGALLSNPRVFILTRLPPAYSADRLARLFEVYGVDLTGRFYSMWEGQTKGDVIASVCAARGVETNEAVLVDDRHDNLEGALLLGARGLLVEHSYNKAYKAALAEKYQERFGEVRHSLLAQALSLLLGNKSAE